MNDIFFGISANEWSEIVRNYVVVFAALVTAYVGLTGLKSWKEQRTWEGDRKLARETLIAQFHLKNTVKSLRRLAVSYQQDLIVDKDVKATEEEDKRMLHAAESLHEELGMLNSALAEFSALAAECSFLWNKRITVPWLQLQTLIFELRISASALRNMYSIKIFSEERKGEYLEMTNGRSLIFNIEEDEFGGLLSQGFLRLQEVIEPYLGRKK